MGTVGPQTELVEAAVFAWSSLSRAIRTVSLYHADHAQVRPWLERGVRALQRCCDYGEPVIFDVRHEDVLIEGTSIAQEATLRPSLVARMYADGIRQIHVRSTLDVRAVNQFAATLAPYQNQAHAPLDSVAERLHWQPLSGLTFVIHARGSITADATTAAEQDWRSRLLAPRAMPGPEHLPDRARVASVWDGTRGQIPWPPPVLPDQIRSLEHELEEADRVGVPVLRIGQIVVTALELINGGAPFAAILKNVERIVDQLLDNDLPDEASHLLQPMARWAGRTGRTPESQAARRDARDFLQLLVADRRLKKLLDGAQQGRYTPQQVAAWFAAVPASSLAEVLRFAAAVPVGPHREALLDVAAFLCQADTSTLEQVVAAGRPGPALLALEVASTIDSTPATARIVRIAVRRTEHAILVRAIQVALGVDDHDVHLAMLEVLRSGSAELRPLALRHMARYRIDEATPLLEEEVTSAQFGRLPLDEQLLICLALGAAGSSRAMSRSRKQLGLHWASMEPPQAGPWILCLAASGAPDAGEMLDWLESKAGPSLRTMVTDARARWNEAKTTRWGGSL
jgi:hypothetical protein